jgi:uncharacterized membrane protein YcgQ (UPF0703/DUF1980 family)
MPLIELDVIQLSLEHVSQYALSCIFVSGIHKSHSHQYLGYEKVLIHEVARVVIVEALNNRSHVLDMLLALLNL